MISKIHLEVGTLMDEVATISAFDHVDCTSYFMSNLVTGSIWLEKLFTSKNIKRLQKNDVLHVLYTLQFEEMLAIWLQEKGAKQRMDEAAHQYFSALAADVCDGKYNDFILASIKMELVDNLVINLELREASIRGCIINRDIESIQLKKPDSKKTS